MAYLSQARRAIQKRCGDIVAMSGIYETAAWGKIVQDSFYNQALTVQTPMGPENLLHEILNIEKELGRVRKEKMGPRVIDIDILLFGDQIIATETLSVPHPLLQERRFVLTPLAEIAAKTVHPILQKNITELLLLCPDTLPVQKINP